MDKMAAHEAAHSVVAHVLGSKVQALTIDPLKGGLLKQEDVRIKAAMPPGEKLNNMVSYGAVAVAGAVFDSGVVFDPEAVFDPGILDEPQYSGDRERLEAMRAAFGMGPEAYEQAIMQGVDRVRNILGQYTDAVREIADEVVRYSGRLDGWRVRKIILKAQEETPKRHLGREPI